MSSGRKDREPRLSSVFLLWALVNLCGLFPACAPPFRVPTQVRIPEGSPRGETETSDLAIRATALADEEAQLELFRANLLLAGLLPIYLEMRNRGDAPIELRRVRVEAADEDGNRLLVRPPKQALRQLFDYYDVMAYRIASREQLERAFVEIAFAFTPALAPGETRRGMLFLALAGEPGPRHAPARLMLTFASLRRARSPEPFSLTLHITAR